MFLAASFKILSELPVPESVAQAYCYSIDFSGMNYGHRTDRTIMLTSHDPEELKHHEAVAILRKQSRTLYINEIPILLWLAAEKCYGIFSPNWNATALVVDRMTRRDSTWRKALLDDLYRLEIDRSHISHILNRKSCYYERRDNRWLRIRYSERPFEREIAHIQKYILRWQSRRNLLPPCLAEYFSARRV